MRETDQGRPVGRAREALQRAEPRSGMSIKVKAMPPPPEDELPPYARDTLCWGCDHLFDVLELRENGLCYKCHRVVVHADVRGERSSQQRRLIRQIDGRAPGVEPLRIDGGSGLVES